jgi:hypothetical protein
LQPAYWCVGNDRTDFVSETNGSMIKNGSTYIAGVRDCLDDHPCGTS